MFATLTQKINQAIQKVRGLDKITASNISGTLKEIRRALVEADVPYKIAKTFVQEVKEKALGQEVHVTISPGQLFTKIVQTQLTEVMGTSASPLSIHGNPSIVLLIGFQGAGKTTLAGKLGTYLKEDKKKSVLLIGCDVYRPAASEQLLALGKKAEIDVYVNKEEKNPIRIIEEGLAEAKAAHKKVVIIDTAGRQSLDEAMMQEIADISERFKPQETLFVVDAMLGQIAIDTIQAFNEKVGFDGVVLTKMDSDTRGGVAIAARKATDKPIKLISTGEKLADLEAFYPDRMAKRILGMDDVVSLVERAERVMDAEKSREVAKKLRQRSFDFNDLRGQLKMFKKMGSLQSLMKLMPGASNLNIDEEQFNRWHVMIDSMTPYERENPDCIGTSRRARIASGSGLTQSQINKMFKDFEIMRKQASRALKKKK